MSLASLIEKEDSIDDLLTVFKGFFAKMLKPRFRKQHSKDLEQNPLALTSMAYRSTSQPLEFIADFNNGKYLSYEYLKIMQVFYDHDTFPYSHKDRSIFLAKLE